jgi:hypothetical protein
VKLRLSIAPVLTIFLLALSANAQKAGAPKRADFFPLSVGNEWKYRHSEGMEFTFKVLSEEKQKDGGVRYLFEKLSGVTVHSWYSKTPDSVLDHRDQYPEQEGLDIKYEPPKPLLKNPLVPGATWSWKGKTITGTDGTESSKVIGPEMVEVPAGKFRAMKVVSQITDAQAPKTVTAWYVDGIGLVKSMTDAGAIKYGWELIDYNFKKKTNPKKSIRSRS